MHRFFCPNISAPKVQITDPNEIHHIKKVLRLQPGDTIGVFNSGNQEAEAEIISINRTGIDIKIKEIVMIKEKKPQLVLGCALPKRVKFEWIIEKCTELGVDKIITLQTARTEVYIREEKRGSKARRFDAIALNAAKQSQRAKIPEIFPVTKFNVALNNCAPKSLRLIGCLACTRQNILDIAPSIKEYKQVIYLIGPEGDFTEDEIQLALSHNFIPISLGANTLKVDTAAICLTGLLSLYRDYGSI